MAICTEGHSTAVYGAGRDFWLWGLEYGSSGASFEGKNVMYVSGAITISGEHKVIVNGTEVIIFEDGHAIILKGDNFNPTEEIQAAIAGHIVMSTASLIADTNLKAQLQTIGRQLIQTR